MSERTGTKAISVYLSPKAARILENYVTNSGYGSTSRTIEEMLLSYDTIYNAYLSTLYFKGIEKTVTDPSSASLLFANIMNSFTLRCGTPLEKAALEKMVNEFKKYDPGELLSGKYGKVG